MVDLNIESFEREITELMFLCTSNLSAGRPARLFHYVVVLTLPENRLGQVLS